MSALYVVLPLALIGAAAWTLAFVWCVRHGQMDDLEGSAWRMLGDDTGTQKLRDTTTSDA